MTRAFVLVLALAACGGGDKPTLAPDGSTDPTPDATPDAPPTEATLTTYVLDLVATQTTATAAARPFEELASLPDPDGDTNNLAAYQSLFP